MMRQVKQFTFILDINIRVKIDWFSGPKVSVTSMMIHKALMLTTFPYISGFHCSCIWWRLLNMPSQRDNPDFFWSQPTKVEVSSILTPTLKDLLLISVRWFQQ